MCSVFLAILSYISPLKTPSKTQMDRDTSVSLLVRCVIEFDNIAWLIGQSDSFDLKPHKYVCITIYQPDTKSNPNPNPNPNPTTKQHALVNIQLNIVACPTCPEKFIRDMLLHRLYYFRL